MVTQTSRNSGAKGSQQVENPTAASEKLIHEIRCQTKHIFSSEQKILIVM